MLSKTLKEILKNKFVSGIIFLLIIIGGYFSYLSFTGNKNIVQYATAAVEKGMLISSISGTGQVSASNQADIKSTVSGEVINLNIVSGQAVTSGAVIALIDDSDTRKELRDARVAFENAQLDLSNLLEPPDELDVLKAESALAAAKRSLEELINPSEDVFNEAETALISAQNSLTKLKFNQEDTYQNALEAKQKSEDNLVAAYEDAFNTVADVFLDLPTLITGLRDVLYGSEIAQSEVGFYNYQNNIAVLINSADTDDRNELEKFINSAESNYKIARARYDINFENYKNVSRYSEKEVVETLLEETIETVRAMAETVKSENNMLDYWVDYRSQHDLKIFSKVTTYQSDIKSYTSKTNSHLSGLLSEQRSLEDCKEAIPDAERDLEEIERDQPIDLAAAERTVQEKEDALDKLKNPEQYDIDDKEIAVREKELALEELKAGADDTDIRSKKLSVQQKYEALVSVQEKLAEHSIKAPFDGTVASVNISKGDTINSGTLIGTMITEQKIAEITLNEIDAAKVKVEQKATLQFDAAEDLSITGKVVEIDTLGTVSQGVVSYGVKIAFDVDDERIKPGMTVSTSIILDSKQNVLFVPLSAVKTIGDSSYVEVLVNNQPERKTVLSGSSNDIIIEIVSGLEEGEEIITQTISNGASSSSTNNSRTNQSNSGFGGAGFGGGELRMLR